MNSRLQGQRSKPGSPCPQGVRGAGDRQLLGEGQSKSIQFAAVDKAFRHPQKLFIRGPYARCLCPSLSLIRMLATSLKVGVIHSQVRQWKLREARGCVPAPGQTRERSMVLPRSSFTCIISLCGAGRILFLYRGGPEAQRGQREAAAASDATFCFGSELLTWNSKSPMLAHLGRPSCRCLSIRLRPGW